jgi:hypothetical protein
LSSWDYGKGLAQISCLTPFLFLFSRRAIWAGKYFVNAKTDGDRLELSRRDLDALLEQLAAVARKAKVEF